MIVTVLVGHGSLALGVAIAQAAAHVQRRRRRNVADETVGLRDFEHDELQRDFAVHVSAVRRKVSDLADALADGDAQLRDCLRLFERGGGRA